MSSVFPYSNLPISSQQWGRQIQERLELLETEAAKQKRNTNSADSQLQASYNRLDETVTEIEKLSEVDSKYKVNLDNLTGEILTSPRIDFQITNPTERVEYPDRIVSKIYNQSDGFASKSGIINIDGSLVSSSEFILRYAMVLENLPTSFPSGGAPIPATPVIIKPSLIISGLSGGGTTGASIDNTGQVIRTTSSERYKQDIEPLQVNYNELLSLEPKRFRLKNEASNDEDARYYPGFIAEDLAETSLTDFVAYTTDEDGNKIPDGVYYAELSTALLSAIKHQDELIKSLSSRIKSLEDKDKV
jgi:hypothetical protein